MTSISFHIGHNASPAQQLIDAINAGNTEALSQVIDGLVRRAQDEDNARAIGRLGTNYLNDQLPGTRLTAMHVAAKAYAHFRFDRNMSWLYDQCVKRLLDAGANPFIEALGTCKHTVVLGKVIPYLEHGQTVLDVCKGAMPPSLKRWLAENVDDTAMQTFSVLEPHSTTLARVQREAQCA